MATYVIKITFKDVDYTEEEISAWANHILFDDILYGNPEDIDHIHLDVEIEE